MQFKVYVTLYPWSDPNRPATFDVATVPPTIQRTPRTRTYVVNCDLETESERQQHTLPFPVMDPAETVPTAVKLGA